MLYKFDFGGFGTMGNIWLSITLRDTRYLKDTVYIQCGLCNLGSTCHLRPLQFALRTHPVQIITFGK